MLYGVTDHYIFTYYSLGTLFNKYYDAIQLQMILHGKDAIAEEDNRPVLNQSSKELEELYGY